MSKPHFKTCNLLHTTNRASSFNPKPTFRKLRAKLKPRILGNACWSKCYWSADKACRYKGFQRGDTFIEFVPGNLKHKCSRSSETSNPPSFQFRCVIFEKQLPFLFPL
eukprot:Protomagalhaensia_wolfi_Nauph_80__2217@NODE_2439_length_1091_cov_50_865019_g1911_i0_p1_GENE_NODE_2439_length_1091_cov_50_865019_g1911_i0NODE_2439_length_1091_cov_50_865019_g1911_i0_p1_ORF_typecomplete_len108_score7_21AstB/PF04996_12/0_068_NODE_2439_length_1091_cov_50_865019_g1911_i06891012